MTARALLRKTVITVALTAVLITAVLTPVAAIAKDKKPAPVDPKTLVWPPAPAPARLRFLAEYHGEDVKGIKKQGVLERLAGVQDLESKSIFAKPTAIAVDSKGRVYVTDTILKIVFVLDTEHKELTYRGDKAPANFTLPMGIALDAQDRLFVTDAERHTVTAFDPDGKVLDIFGEKELGRPVGLAIDGVLNRLYVADMKARKVAQFKLDTFEFERWIGKSMEEKVELADAPKILSSPTSLVVDPDGLLYVVDTFTNRVVVFDPDGELARNFGEVGQKAGQFMRPRGIALDSDGHVYVSDAFFNVVQVLTPEGKALMPVGKPGADPGSFRVPSGMAFDKFNRLFVVDQYNARIQVFRYITDAETPPMKRPDKADKKSVAANAEKKK
jgi:DNA-binding beta-propeller fold protein YncE